MQITINLEGGKPKAENEGITIVAPSMEPAVTPKSKAKSDSLTEIACAALSIGVLVVITVKPVNVTIKGYIHQPAASRDSAQNTRSANSKFILPVAKNHCVTSEFDPARLHPISGKVRPHEGIDLGDSQGTPILVVASGTVTSAKTNGGYGNQVVVNHGNGLSTSYSHLSEIKVNQGQQIGQGDVIGLMGSTGSSTAPHLHFEVREGGVAKNPREYIQFKGLREGC